MAADVQTPDLFPTPDPNRIIAARLPGPEGNASVSAVGPFVDIPANDFSENEPYQPALAVIGTPWVPPKDQSPLACAPKWQVCQNSAWDQATVSIIKMLPGDDSAITETPPEVQFELRAANAYIATPIFSGTLAATSFDHRGMLASVSGVMFDQLELWVRSDAPVRLRFAVLVARGGGGGVLDAVPGPGVIPGPAFSEESD